MRCMPDRATRTKELFSPRVTSSDYMVRGVMVWEKEKEGEMKLNIYTACNYKVLSHLS